MKRLIFPFLMLLSSCAFGWTPVSSAVGTIQNRSTLQAGATFYTQTGIVQDTMTVLGVLSVKDPTYDSGVGRWLYFNSNQLTYPGDASLADGFLHFNTFDFTGLGAYGIKFGECFDESCSNKVGLYKYNHRFTVHVGTYGCTDPSNHPRIEVHEPSPSNNYARIDFNRLNQGFALTESSMTFEAGAVDPILDWATSGTLNLFGNFSASTITASVIGVPDLGYFYAGTDQDLQLYHTGTSGTLSNATGSLTTINTNTGNPIAGKLIYTSSFTNTSTTGNMYGILTNSYISGGTSNPGGSPVYIPSYEDIDVVLSTTFNTSFNSYVGKKFDITLTGIPGTGSAGLGTSTYGVQYNVNASGSFNGNFVTLLAPIYNSVSLTNVVAGGSGFTSLVENQMTLSGTCNIGQLHGISLTMNMGSGSSVATLRGIYLSMNAGTTIATNESYGIYQYLTTGGAGYFSYPTFYGSYIRTDYASTMNGIGVYTEMTNDLCGSWSLMTAKGDSIIRELYVGLPYRGTVGVTGGDLKANIVVNYGFSADTDWSKGTGWTISGGNAVKAAGTASNLTPTVPLAPKPGRVYAIQMAWTTYTAGNLSIQFGGQTFSVARKVSNGQTYFHMKAISTGTLTLVADSTANYSINYIFIREIGDSNLYMAEGKLNFWDTNNYIKSNSEGFIDISVSSGVRIGTYTANYTMFNSSGYQTMAGEAQPWDDLRIEPVARTTGANAPTFEEWADDAGWRQTGTTRGIYLYTFDDAVGGSEKEVMFTMQMPHDWNGDVINVHVHWVGRVDDTTAAPRWGLEYAWRDIGTTFSTTTVIYSDGVNYTDTGTSVNISSGTHYISKFAGLSPGTTQDNASSILIGRLFRDSANAGDTYNAANADCGLLYIDAHYRRNKLGSQTEY